jgi:hypothetical protein
MWLKGKLALDFLITPTLFGFAVVFTGKTVGN